MRTAIAVLAIFAASPALAHPGHYTESAGHTHWLALAALATALVVGIALLRRERRVRAARKDAERRV